MTRAAPRAAAARRRPPARPPPRRRRRGSRTPTTATWRSPSRSVRPPVVHPAGRQRGAVDHAAASAGGLDRAQQRDVLEHLGAHRARARRPGGRPPASTTSSWPLAAASDGRGDRSATRSGSVVSQDHCSSGCTSRSAGGHGELARVGRHQVQRGPPQQRDRRGDRVRRQHHVGVDEDQHASGVVAGAPRRQLGAGPRLAPPPGRQRLPRRAAAPAGRRRPPGVRHRPCRRSSRRRAPGPGGRARRSGRAASAGTARPGAPRRAAAAARATGSATGGGSAGGTRSRRRFQAACTAPATASPVPSADQPAHARSCHSDHR